MRCYLFNQKFAIIFSICTLLLWGGGSVSGSEPNWMPPRAKSYSHYDLGFLHGVQYWIYGDATIESIDEDFRKMAQEDMINAARLPFWGLFYYAKDKQLTEADFRLADMAFDAAAKYNIKINPVLPQITGWLDGTADKPEIRADYNRYIKEIVSHYKDKPALGMWTVDIEPSRSYKVQPCQETIDSYRKWLPQRYHSLDEFKAFNLGMSSFETAYPITGRGAGPWNNFAGFNDWLTYTAHALTEQTRLTAQAVKEVDPIHPTSCTPPDVLHNQIIENGRNMWWLADVVDYPGSQMHPHWHLETADMPEDVLSAQACSIHKVYNSSRGRPASYVGEVMGGPEIAFESTRFYTVSAEELMCTTLTHLAEGVKGYFYWIWNPLKEGPIAGAWSLRTLTGKPSERSILLANFGKMVHAHDDLLYQSRPEDARVAIFDSLDAAIYLGRRSAYQPMSEWYVKNQYGFWKAMRKTQIPCDFIDERGLYAGEIKKYDVIYLPFSMTMESDIAEILADYVQSGGTIIADCMTAFTPKHHLQYDTQPGTGLDKIFGIEALDPICTFSGWAETDRVNKEEYFERLQTRESDSPYKPLFDKNGKKSPLVAWKIMQPVEPLSAKVLYQDSKGRAIGTVNQFGKGHAVWTGTLLGYSCRQADTPFNRYQAVAEMVQQFIPKPNWQLKAPDDTIVCRRLTGKQGELFVLINEGKKPARFTLDLGRNSDPRELLWPDNPCWQKNWFSKHKINGLIKPLSGTVIFCPD